MFVNTLRITAEGDAPAQLADDIVIQLTLKDDETTDNDGTTTELKIAAAATAQSLEPRDLFKLQRRD